MLTRAQVEPGILPGSRPERGMHRAFEMTSAFVASVVRAVLAERDLPDALIRVAALPFSWEVTLRNPSGVEWCLMVPDGSSRGFADVVRGAFSTLPLSYE